MIPVGTPCWLLDAAPHHEYTNHCCTVIAHGTCGATHTEYWRHACVAVCRVRLHDGTEGCIPDWRSLRPLTPPGIDARTLRELELAV